MTSRTCKITDSSSNACTTELVYRDLADNRTTSYVRRIKYTNSGGGLSLMNRVYGYDGNGNIIAEKVLLSDNPTETIGDIRELYTYDSRNELIRHDSKTHNKTWTFSYDLGGNILQKKEYAYTTGTPGTALSTVNYTYGTGASADRVTSFGGQSVTYDGLGNITAIGSRSFTWDGRNLTGISESGLTWSATYGAGGVRLSKTVNGTVTKFFVSGSRLLAQQTGGVNTWFLYDNVGRIAGILYNGTAYYYMYNVQGDVVAIVNCGTGKAVTTYEYDAWGNCTVTKASGSVIGDVNPIRYRGYYYDSETGLYYLNGRYYDPQLCRFISPDDTAVLTAAMSSLTYKNLYAYCDNNPTVREDKSGQLWTLAVLLTRVVVPAVVGAVVGVAGQLLTDLQTQASTGSSEFSSWETYLGAAIGGAVGVVVGVNTGNMALSGGITSGLTTLISDVLNVSHGKAEMTAGEIIVDTAIDTGFGAAAGAANLYSAVEQPVSTISYNTSRAINTILPRTIANKASFLESRSRSFVKNLINGLFLDFYYGLKQSLTR